MIRVLLDERTEQYVRRRWTAAKRTGREGCWNQPIKMRLPEMDAESFGAEERYRHYRGSVF